MPNPDSSPKATTARCVGRFAPSPTGELHLGSLITAVASYCLAKRDGGQWLVRIEDVDNERCQPRFASHILKDLERLGLYWDGAVRYQSQHLATYHHLLDSQLLPMTYGCACSRKSIAQYIAAHHLGESRYPQLCTAKQLARHHAIRLRLPHQTLLFFDQLQGVITGNPQLEHGDIVLRRKSDKGSFGMINYMLAAVVDDAVQGVTQVVRGLDILPLTIPQLVLADYLNLPFIKHYYHLPILVNEDGQKLSKQTLAQPIAPFSPPSLIKLALRLLGQPSVDTDTPSVMLNQAIAQWDNQPLQGKKQKKVAQIEQLLSDQNHQ